MEDSLSIQRSGSQRSLGSRKSLSGSRKVAALTGDDGKLESGAISIDLEAQTSIDSNCAKETRSDSITDEEAEQTVPAFDFKDSSQQVYVPLPGQTTMNAEATKGKTNIRRMVTSGCAICLCRFNSEENITWSANPNCPHVFHGDCILHWYLAVGRKVQKRRLRNHPDMEDDDVLTTICEFPTNCPCCRQSFCQDIRKTDASASSAATENDSDEEQQSGEENADIIQTGSTSDRNPE
jgi:hypothetical protein